jgi:hypothetical protein
MREFQNSVESVVTPEQLIGLSTLEVAKYVVGANSEVDRVMFRKYCYIPNVSSGPNDGLVPMTRNEFLGGTGIESIIANLDEGFNLALDSRVVLKDGTAAHFQMMDLSPRKSPESLEKVTQQFGKIIVPKFGGGVLLETNKSYHYFGFGILKQEEWLDFLGLNLITSIVTYVGENQPRAHEIISDYRYIGHAMLRRSTGLRVTTRGTKVFEPKVIAVIS